jgi:putative transposase
MCAQRLDTKARIAQIDREKKKISLQRQCELLGINRSTFYYEAKPKKSIDRVIVEQIEQIHVKWPGLGHLKIQAMLSVKGLHQNHKKILHLTKENGLQAIFSKSKPKTTIANIQHKKVGYLLRNLEITRPNQVLAVDITYIKIGNKYVYLFGIIDVFSRKIIGWIISPLLDTEPCVETFEEAVKELFPEIVNSDQGCQFTSEMWAKAVTSCGAKMSMDGKGRWADNIIIERFWRTVKQEFIRFYIFDTLEELKIGLAEFIEHYNTERPHQALKYKTPEFVYTTGQGPAITINKQKSEYWERKKDEELAKIAQQSVDKFIDLINKVRLQKSEVKINTHMYV